MLWRTLPPTVVVTTAAVFADTATVRRICAQPDSVIAGRRTCVLRDQRAITKIF